MRFFLLFSIVSVLVSVPVTDTVIVIAAAAAAIIVYYCGCCVVSDWTVGAGCA